MQEPSSATTATQRHRHSATSTTTPSSAPSATAGNRNWHKFRLLLWKNWLLQWRHPVQMSVEILAPILFSALLVLVRSLVDPETVATETHFHAVPVVSLAELRAFKKTNETSSYRSLDYRLCYAPNTSQPLQELMDRAGAALNLSTSVGFADTKALEHAMMEHNYLAAVDFTDSRNALSSGTYAATASLAKRLRYSLRFPSVLRNTELLLNWRTRNLFPPFQQTEPRNKDYDNGGIPPGYQPEGFLAVQTAVTSAFLATHAAGARLPYIDLQRFPYPPYIKDILLDGLKNLVSLIVMLSFVYPCTNTVKFIAYEKELQLKEAMKIMGLPNWLHWSGWFVRSTIFNVITITLMVIMLTVPWYPGPLSVSVFTHASSSALWLFLFVYGLATTGFCFMLSVFFARANTAAAVSGLVWFLFYSVFSFTEKSYDAMGLALKLVLSLFSNTGMAFGVQLIVRWEGTGEGLQWSNFWRPVSVDDNLSVGEIVVMLLLDAMLYFLIALYVEQIYPGEYGMPQKWWFPVSRQFWCGSKDEEDVVQQVQSAGGGQQAEDVDVTRFEAEPLRRRAGVRVQGLHKRFGKQTAVQPMHVNMYDDQITVLLGHNGAGKSTTMNMLTGMLKPTAGTALVDGRDVRTDVAAVRRSLGLCPQHNILFDELTVQEHIVFYCSLKGMPADQIPAEVDKYLGLINLEPKRHAQSSTLSGGMKRKLSVCVAFCGGSRVVLCDEPTSGMDPAARRALWDVLQHEKHGRTVLLSTHFMDEADVLGDRIAIMANGRIKCCGSSYFLKRRFGPGYRLVCVKEPHCRVDEVTQLLRKHCGQVRVENNVGTELSYQLDGAWSGSFVEMFKELEENTAALGLSGFGVSLTTLEEVFMAVGTDGKDVLVVPGVGGEREQDIDELYNTLETPQLYTGARLIRHQIAALLQKKLLQTYRSLLMLLIQIIIPTTFIIITMLAEERRSQVDTLPPLHIDHNVYKRTETVLQVPAAAASSSSALGDAYRQLFNANDQAHKLSVTTTADMESFVLAAYAKNTARTNREMICGASVHNATHATAWFNNQPYHGAPLAVHTLHAAAVRAQLGADYGIELDNFPIPYTVAQRAKFMQMGSDIGFQLAVNLSFAMAFVAAFYVLPYIRERTSGSKHLQMVSGARIISYWLTALAWDFITYTLTVLVLLIIFAAFQRKGWSTGPELARISLVLALFGWAMLPVTYLLSRLFREPASGFTRVAVLYVFSGMACFFIVIIMSFPEYDLKHVADGLTWLFLTFPHFALSHSLNSINLMVQQEELCRMRCDYIPGCTRELMCALLPSCCSHDYFGWTAPGIGRHLLYMVATGAATLLWLLMIEHRIFGTLVYRLRSSLSDHWPPWRTQPSAYSAATGHIESTLDSDVLAERQTVAAIAQPAQLEQHNLVVHSMTKDYGRFRAVNQLSFVADGGDCFGLLGTNGAGKTSTFGMLTGSQRISGGNAWVRGLSVRTAMTAVQKGIGYCPQFDALIGEMTGRETLRMYCALRGIPAGAATERITRVLAVELGMERHLDKPTAAYSGGTKRKLSTALALCGNPTVVYLDEPTTGMDPNAKRALWNVVTKVRRMGKAVVLTSHSMDECEALCTRLTIMVGGEFRCLGSVQHLKSKFGAGYTLMVKLRKGGGDGEEAAGFGETVEKSDPLPTQLPQVQQLKQFVRERLPSAQLQQEFQEQLIYNVPLHATDALGEAIALRWSDMFGVMEAAKRLFDVEDYAISQTSLEQVFLAFANQQRTGGSASA